MDIVEYWAIIHIRMVLSLCLHSLPPPQKKKRINGVKKVKPKKGPKGIKNL